MPERQLVVSNALGLHARAATKLVQLLDGFGVHAALTARGREVNARSIMGLMMLAAAQGTAVLLRVEGPNAEDALAAAAALFQRNFDEDG